MLLTSEFQSLSLPMVGNGTFSTQVGKEITKNVGYADLIETGNEESSGRLNRYLNYELIHTREAIRAIQDDYQDIFQQRQIKTNLSEAWTKLVEEVDEFLIHVVARKTESLCGYKPTSEQVLNFLKNLKRNHWEKPIQYQRPPGFYNSSPRIR